MNYLTYHVLRFIYISQKWLLKQFTPTGLGVLACFVITGIAGLGSPKSMTYLLFFFVLALLVLAFIGTRFIHFRFKAIRFLPRFGTVGEPLRYEAIIQNLTPTAQPGLKLVEKLPDHFPSLREFIHIKKDYVVGSRWFWQWGKYVAEQRWAIAHPQDLPPLMAATKTKVMGEILPLRRGHLSLKSVTLGCPDPLGLIYKHQSFDINQSICILPKRYRLPPLQLSHARRYQIGQNSLVSSIGEALEFRSLRDYRPGDPTNKIHWKSWAKVGRPIVKEQQDESAVHHALILDTFQAEPQSEIFEEAIAVAISFLTQENPQEKLLDVIFATHEATHKARCVTVGRRIGQRAPILETLATLTPCQKKELEILTPILQERLPRLSGCFCIFLRLDEGRYAFLKMIAQYGIPITAIFLCEQNLLPHENFGHDLTPRCRTRLVSIDNMQQDLLLI